MNRPNYYLDSDITLQLHQTTHRQLDLIKDVIRQEARSVHALWLYAQNNADCTDQIDYSLDNLHSALENLCTDLNIVGAFVDGTPTEPNDPKGWTPCERVVRSTDNRDDSTTWLWLDSDCGEYVEVNPTDLYDNMLENLPWGSGLAQLKRLVQSGELGWDDVREWECKDYYEKLDEACGWEDAEMLYGFVQHHYFGTEV